MRIELPREPTNGRRRGTFLSLWRLLPELARPAIFAPPNRG